MLAHLLAIAVGVGSVALYLAAFFFPEVHRKHDFFWSGVGCFYALVLWVDASQISATELLGHTAANALVARFGWQTLTLRRKRTPQDLQTPLTDQSWQTFGQEITTLGATWLRRTPLGRILPRPATKPSSPSPSLGGVRASSLKQVDYEFVDDLPNHYGGGAKESSGQSSGLSGVQQPSAASEQATQPGQSVLSQPQSEITTASQQQANSAQNPNVRAPQKPGTLLEKGSVLKDWLVEVVTAVTKPKPKKPVIVIPPRDSQPETKPKARAPETTSEQTTTESGRADISVSDMQAVNADQDSPPDSPKHGEPLGAHYPTEGMNVGEPEGGSSRDEKAAEAEDQPGQWDEIDNWSEFEAEVETPVEPEPLTKAEDSVEPETLAEQSAVDSSSSPNSSPKAEDPDERAPW